jgi:hypothetical protein
MPIEKPTNKTAPVYSPKENYSIVKYMDLAKFISLLQTESLFFCRLDKMEDKFEGTSPRLSIEQIKKIIRNLYTEGHLKTSNIDESVSNHLSKRLEIEDKIKKLTCISCWNKNTTESYALWKIYSDINKGIMVTSSINNLIESFKSTPEKIKLSEIKYINHDTDYIPIDNTNFPIIHKNLAYSYEQELRLIYQVEAENGLIYNWKPEENGKYLKTNLNILIEEIVLSPYSPEWFYEIIEDLLFKYRIEKKIKYSKLKK